ncbi:hypothetical protein [Brachyspira pilosicoli]|uniref:hypothetical protein n=1 Tax=Brachyspira pilosicoli TaxID=52584 RepID=UPI0026667EB3|nr:hypothetical protein [Brachyspira pilosicoli]
MDKENKSKNGWGGARANSGGRREGAGRKKLPPEKKAKPVKAISFKISRELYSKAENIAEKNNLSIGQYAKKILLDNINKN